MQEKYRTCYRDITRRRAYVNKLDEGDDASEELSKFVEENVVKSCNVLSMAGLSEKYTEIQPRQFGEQGTTSLKMQSLKDKLKRTFRSKIGFLAFHAMAAI